MYNATLVSEQQPGKGAESEFKEKRVGTFGRLDLAKILSRYTSELLGVEQPPLDEKTAAKFELGRRAMGHLPHIRIIEIRKLDVIKTGPGEDDIRVDISYEGSRRRPIQQGLLSIDQE